MTAKLASPPASADVDNGEIAIIDDAAPVRSDGMRWPAKLALALGPFIVLQLLSQVAPGLFPDWGVLLPDGWTGPEGWLRPTDRLNVVVDYLKNDELLGLFSVKAVTRAIASWLDWPLDFAEGLLFEGWPVNGLPWVMLVGLVAVLGWYLKGPRLALVAGGCMAYFALFASIERWELSMITLASVLVSAPAAALLGLILGIIAAKKRWFEKILVPYLNFVQAMPHFVYLLPVAVFVGLSQKAGVIATIFFAYPPMARLTILGIRGIGNEVREAGLMSGTNPLQMLWKVELPAARRSLMVGVNQVIMGCLGMVVIASLVGTNGLGQDLRIRLQRLNMGQALEVGIAVVLMAIMLDRLSQAAAERQPVHSEETRWWVRRKFALISVAVVVLSLIAAQISDYFRVFPEKWALSFVDPVDSAVSWMQTELRLDGIRDFVLLNILQPLESGVTSVPWLAAVALVAGIGLVIGGWRLGATAGGLVLLIALSGYWIETLETLYMTIAGVVISVGIGIPVGIWASKKERRLGPTQVVLDTFQTMPSFVYLLPAIMLFKVSQVAVLVAIVVYPVVPAVRYTMLGLRSVPEDLIEAAKTSGSTERQVLWKVKMPLALPEILLGINQTIMFTLFMVMIGALIISDGGLSSLLIKAITDQDIGTGFIAGSCAALVGLTADQLIRSWARDRKEKLGLL